MTFSLAPHGATPSVRSRWDVELPKAPPDGAAVDSAPRHVSSKGDAQMLRYITYGRIHSGRAQYIASACIDSHTVALCQGEHVFMVDLSVCSQDYSKSCGCS